MDIKVSDYVDKNLITSLEIQGNVSGIGDVKLKEIYKGSRNADAPLLIDKQYEKHVYTSVNKISFLEKHNMYLGKQEKLKILYLYFSVDLKIPLQSRGNEERTHKGNTQKTPNNYSTHISNENTTSNNNSFNNQQNYDNQIENTKFNLSYENNVYLNQNNNDDEIGNIINFN
ncbi:hypothetical protein H8356DRAFT_930028 [Neocallimastix lanati (nom. inval.)]|nr:hypothetical protein H8356DRAFT_930028 [Neocallimastix sp. JGI-2020a]